MPVTYSSRATYTYTTISDTSYAGNTYYYRPKPEEKIQYNMGPQQFVRKRLDDNYVLVELRTPKKCPRCGSKYICRERDGLRLPRTYDGTEIRWFECLDCVKHWPALKTPEVETKIYKDGRVKVIWGS